MTHDPNFRMTDLEENLAGPGGTAFKAEVLQKLQTSGSIVSKQIDAGLSTNAFETAQLLYQALAAAHEVVSKFPVKEPENHSS